MTKRFTFYIIFKWLVLIAAYSYLAYKLITFDNYNVLFEQWELGWLHHAKYLLVVIVLLPFNWLFETLKWKFLLRKLEVLLLKDAFKSVMIGNTTAFFTPNRLGEFPGRSITLSQGKKLQGITIGVLGSISQTLTIMLFGIPSAWILFFFHNSNLNPLNYISFIAVFIGLIIIYFFLPRLCLYLKAKKLFHKIENLLLSITEFSFLDLMGVLLLSLFRYLIFCTQFYFMLLFFGVDLHPLYGAIAIATNYLFVTFTPSLSFSEGAVRASVAVLVIGILSTNIVGIAAAGLGIWLINFVIPMLIGSVIFAKK